MKNDEPAGDVEPRLPDAQRLSEKPAAEQKKDANDRAEAALSTTGEEERPKDGSLLPDNAR